MSTKRNMNQAEAERMIKVICEWLANGAQDSTLTEEESFGTVRQDLTIGFAQEMFDSVGLPVNSLLKIVRSLSPNHVDNNITKIY